MLNLDGARLFVVAPHPDDETLACGTLLQRVREAGGAVRVCVVTCGDAYSEALRAMPGRDDVPLEAADFLALGRLRMHETRRALALCGVGDEEVVFLGYPDTSLAALFQRSWSVAQIGSNTRVSAVPYAAARRPGAAHAGAELVRDLAEELDAFRPTIVCAPHTVDAHGDHRATAAFLQAALARTTHAPRLELAYAIHGEPESWVAPRDHVLAATPHERATKVRALARYRSQRRVIGGLLDRFGRRDEWFAELPPPATLRPGEGFLPVLASDAPATPDIDAALEAGLHLVVRPRERPLERARTRWSLELLELGPEPRRTRVAWSAAEALVEEGEARASASDGVLTVELPVADEARPFLFSLKSVRDQEEVVVGWRRCLVRARAAT